MDTLLAPTAGQPSTTSPLAQQSRTALPSDGLEILPIDSIPSEPEQGTPVPTTSTTSTKVDPPALSSSRGSTLRKNSSFRKRSSLSRRGSKKSLRTGEHRGSGTDVDPDSFNNIFHTPVPTTGNPTDVLANRFQAWRKLLKDLITYFREIQSSYESRSKALIKLSNVVNNTQAPPIFMSQGGLNDALTTLRGFHKVSLTEANKARDIEDDVITQLNGLRNDLNQKIKEIKSLSDDFKNSVEKKKETTRRAVASLQDVLNSAEGDVSPSSGRSDPYIVRLNVERQVELQIEEENYLHRAYLNLEGSGRELESIVVGEIQKAYNAYVGILRREAEYAHDTLDTLRSGPIAMPKDQEWLSFVEHNDHFINPKLPLRHFGDIVYPGKFHPSALEIRSGMLERKSKYLKSYTPGWYVLSPTHLHEFKSGDHLHTQTPVMSLYLLDQKLGSHSNPDATSHKFSFKGRQTGGLHRGHSWVFRAESYDTLMAWYDAIKILTETTTAERNAFVRRHARSVSANSNKPPSVSSDGIDADEADAEPFSGRLPREDAAVPLSKRPEPGGRFPSDVDVNRGLQAPISPSSTGSAENKDISVKDSVDMVSSERPTNQHPASHNALEAVDRRDYSQNAALSSSAAVSNRNGDTHGASGKAEPSTLVSSPQALVAPAVAYDERAAPSSQAHELPATDEYASNPVKPDPSSVREAPNTASTAVEGVSGGTGSTVAGLGLIANHKNDDLDEQVDALASTPAKPLAEHDVPSAGAPSGIYLSPENTTGSSTNSSSSTLTAHKAAALTAMVQGASSSSSAPRHDIWTKATELHVPGGFPPTPSPDT